MSNASVVACINGPDLDLSELALREFVASVRSAPQERFAYPESCATFELSPRRCEYIVGWARREAGLAEADPAAIELLGDPACPGHLDAMPCGIMRTTTFVVRVRVTPANGEPTDHSVFCGIHGDASLLCTDRPVIWVLTPTSNGYWDVPCSGEAPEGCATPLPSIEPAAADDAEPLTLHDVHIPIDHVGDYRVPMGEATLPNGILSETSVTLGEHRPTTFLVEGGRVEVLLSGTQPFDNGYAHGWHPGSERVAVTLKFTVESFDSGAELVVQQLVVR